MSQSLAFSCKDMMVSLVFGGLSPGSRVICSPCSLVCQVKDVLELILELRVEEEADDIVPMEAPQ